MGKRILEQERNEILSLYIEHGTLLQVSKKTNRSIGAIKKIIDNNSETIQRMRKKADELIISPENILLTKLSKLQNLSERALERLELMVDHPMKYDVTPKDLINIYKLHGDTIYQLKNIAIKEKMMQIEEEKLKLLKQKLEGNIIDFENDEEINLDQLLFDTLENAKNEIIVVDAKGENNV